MLNLLASILFWVSIAVYGVFWIWAVIHATHTPRADRMQRALWGVAMLANPATAMWYWYIWKRWAFITIFTPVCIAFLAFPFIIRSVVTQADETAITNVLYSFGSARLLILVATLMVFPLLLRLIAILDIGKNAELTALDRNDWIVAIALPVFGFGAAIAYLARHRRGWALAGLLWWAVIFLVVIEMLQNVSPVLVQAGDVIREAVLESK